MAISKDKKRELLAKLADVLAEARSVVFVSFSKLTVTDASAMRHALSQEGVRYLVAKKTLLRLALASRGYEGQAPELPGEVALAWTALADTTVPARAIYAFGKKLKGAVVLVGGVFENAFADAAAITAIAIIPPLPVLRGMFVNVINSPIQGLVIALDKIAAKRAA
ncbi:MAG: 50S ribosomal protein L10 [bacterium]|nr:50S ribosomal protein L10 [bacterium]